MAPERAPDYQSSETEPLSEAELDEVQQFVRGPLRDYLLKREDGEPLFRKAGLNLDSDLAKHIQLAGNRENLIAMPVDKNREMVTQREVYRMVKILQRLIEMGAGESN